FNIEKGEKILLCEDVITTGGTLMELIELLKAYEVKIVGITSIINRTNKEYFNSLHFKSLLRLDFKTYEADECPMCKEGLPITIPGIKANK
ncbi:MAG: phosphoribosyltransferase family protein, partial [Promethearchaeota archaeon]